MSFDRVEQTGIEQTGSRAAAQARRDAGRQLVVSFAMLMGVTIGTALLFASVGG
ncbi:hypothetical protein JI664_05080 [Rhodobacter sp. NTK016B]|uniref:hypothetical protein n=1 Tax=Rhodobacter sp. NTK016B TaxID=2759676 RepID=UPI001A8DC328|nr:hypothetical protein [Rhodobacter sp. NTK016B]MBN8291327.1 hypothetical protein [Rhodobacter sp. NTK016B]